MGKKKKSRKIKCSSSTHFFSLWTGNWTPTWHFRFHVSSPKSSKIVTLSSQYITKRLCYPLDLEVIDFALADLRVEVLKSKTRCTLSSLEFRQRKKISNNASSTHTIGRHCQFCLHDLLGSVHP